MVMRALCQEDARYCGSTNRHHSMTATTQEITVGQALTQFYADHDFGEEGGINDAFAYAKLGPINIPIPNTAARKEVIWLHDLHHLLNGYDTTWPGEGQVSAWELAAGGFGTKIYIWLLVLLAGSVGVLLFPASTFRAFVRGTYCQSIVSLGLPRDQLKLLPVNELKQRVGIVSGKTYVPAFGHYVRFGLLWLLYMGSIAGLVAVGTALINAMV